MLFIIEETFGKNIERKYVFYKFSINKINTFQYFILLFLNFYANITYLFFCKTDHTVFFQEIRHLDKNIPVNRKIGNMKQTVQFTK